jgi:hypothetical protein
MLFSRSFLQCANGRPAAAREAMDARLPEIDQAMR